MKKVVIKYLLEQGQFIGLKCVTDERFNCILEELDADKHNWVTRTGYIKYLEKSNKELYLYSEIPDIFPILLKLPDTLDKPKEKTKYEILFNTETFKEGKLLAYIDLTDIK